MIRLSQFENFIFKKIVTKYLLACSDTKYSYHTLNKKWSFFDKLLLNDKLDQIYVSCSDDVMILKVFLLQKFF